ncbi:hypothetical protein K1T71_013077 [Dendrolimus kikuchii]|uniref:Uncharacterized protein n=1 Tax=Dendrolimus kikuchii TaxID=765133 RepID=A0ACC1CIZ2_9NEOP|nr:hypothetical protein K1T71_013077 [Dendrolimus kikuchii]
MRHRDSLFKKTKKYPTDEALKITYKRYRNFCNNLLKKLKNDYDKTALLKAKNNSKLLWDTIKNITHMKKPHESSTQLLSSANPNDSINKINSYFSKIGSDLAQIIISKNILSPCQPPTSSVLKSFVLLPTTESEIDTIIVNSNGIFPDLFKKSVIIPVYKSGDKSHVGNYRPISILPALSKILERLLNNRLTKYLESNNLISTHQFGFRSGKSTDAAVETLTNYITTKLDKKQKVIAIFLDLAKWLLKLDYDSTEALLVLVI